MEAFDLMKRVHDDRVAAEAENRKPLGMYITQSEANELMAIYGRFRDERSAVGQFLIYGVPIQIIPDDQS